MHFSSMRAPGSGDVCLGAIETLARIQSGIPLVLAHP